MKKRASSLSRCCSAATPAYAQLGGLSRALDQGAGQAQASWPICNISEKEERQLGERRQRQAAAEFGVYQDKDVTKYVSLVGTVLAQASSRPDLNGSSSSSTPTASTRSRRRAAWCTSPRGALGLIKNEAELAGVLGTRSRTSPRSTRSTPIQKSKATKWAPKRSARRPDAACVAKLAELAYERRHRQRLRSRRRGRSRPGGRARSRTRPATTPPACVGRSTKLDGSQQGLRQEPNGLFASHPDHRGPASSKITKADQGREAGRHGDGAQRATRRRSRSRPSRSTAIATVTPGRAAWPAVSSKSRRDKKKSRRRTKQEEEPKKKGGLLGKFNTSTSEQKQSSRRSHRPARAGIGVPDRDAKGGATRTRWRLRSRRRSSRPSRRGSPSAAGIVACMPPLRRT